MNDYRNISRNDMILGEGRYYSMDTLKTGLANHVLCVGGTGTGKTRSIVSPNILQASGSYVISDPKGNLYGKYGAYLRSRGYSVKKLNFADPGDESSCHYNFLNYIHTEQDVMKIAHILTYAMYDDSGAGGSFHGDPFWDQASELLLQALIGYVVFYGGVHNTLSTVLALIRGCNIDENDDTYQSMTDNIFLELARKKGQVFPVRCYDEFRQAATRTLKSILITTSSKLGRFDTEETRRLLSGDDISISSIGKKKTAIFVIVSDSDRSMDVLANIFFSQCMNELCSYADRSCAGQVLPVPVRFILDDFATNVRIADFPRMIASIRSRGISVMLLIQSEAQLRMAYGTDSLTIIGNCDTYVYLGGNDLETCEHIAERCDMPLADILYMPVRRCIIFRRGERPVLAHTVDLDEFTRQRKNEKEKE